MQNNPTALTEPTAIRTTRLNKPTVSRQVNAHKPQDRKRKQKKTAKAYKGVHIRYGNLYGFQAA